jgi:hypothetical protein
MPVRPGLALVSRRRLLVGLSALALVSWPPGRRADGSAPFSRASGYRVDISLAFGVFRYSITGRVVEEIDAGAGRYRVLITGGGTGVTSRVEASGLIDGGRYRPLTMRSAHSLAGRQSWLTIAYDYDRGLVDYHAVGHTLLRGRRREVVDVVALPAGQPIDDAISASLNFATGRLDRDADGAYRTSVLRRVRPPDEGPEDVTPGAYRVEVVPLRLRVEPDPATGKLITGVNMAGWSSWARADEPARIVFSAERRIESIESRLVLGSAVRLRLT